MDKSIYELENTVRVRENISEMKIIMIKGIGYMCVGKNSKLNSETMLNIATSMEERSIEL
jgi:hypothetical protein